VPDDDDQPGGPRGFWSGTIAFGLVSVPVSLFVATRPSRVSLRMVDENGRPLSRVYFCGSEERPLTRDEIVRGYEVEKDHFVMVDDEELDAIAPEKTQEINLERFVEVSDIDPVYFERAYFLAPGRGGARPYRLLARVMEDSGRAGIATFVMRGKEYLVAIISERGILRAETMRFHDELRTPEDVGLPDLDKADNARQRRIEKAIRALEAAKLDREVLSDRRAGRLERLVQRKLEAGTDVVSAPEEAEPGDQEGAEVIDLMQVLRRSLEEKEPGPRSTESTPRERKSVARERKSATRERKSAARERKSAAGKGPRSASRRGNLEERPKSELYERAKSLAIPGRSNMTKDELIEAIRDAG
jgi:DNA end-binding protein Ku